jgi:hypothetical protein
MAEMPATSMEQSQQQGTHTSRITNNIMNAENSREPATQGRAKKAERHQEKGINTTAGHQQ